MTTFQGKSDSGNLEEALQQAIQIAKEELHTDHLYWKIESIIGENGGFIDLNILYVTISVDLNQPAS